MSTPASSFFMSYSRENISRQRKVIAGLRERGVSVWVDVENLIPGSPAREREIERAIRGAAGVIVLLSPEANNSEQQIHFVHQRRRRQRSGLDHEPGWAQSACAVQDVANKDQASCEIYLMRLDGSAARQPTSNHYCDCQPRWGN